MNIEKLSDVQSEAGIIATLIDKPSYLLYSETLKPNDFFDTTNACIYWAVTELYSANIENIDAYNLIRIINYNKAVSNQIWGNLSSEKDRTKFINDFIRLSKAICRPSQVEYVELVKTILDFSTKRNMVLNLEKSINNCFENIEAVDVYKNVQKNIDSVMSNHQSCDVVAFGKIIKNLWNESREKLNNGGLYGYKPKINELAKYFLYEMGELILYLGKRKSGKSMLALNEAVNLLKQDVGVLYIDTELRDSLFKDRLISHCARVPFKRLKSGDYDEPSAIRIDKAIEWLEDKNFYHCHMPNYSKEKLYLLAKKLKKNNNVTFFIFDHLKTTDSKDASSGYYELGSKINFLKDILCGELNYAGICLAQLNRGGDVGDSYRLEQEPSAVVSLFAKTKNEINNDGVECGNMKLFVKANRLGEQMDDPESDYVDVNFKGHLCSFENTKQHNVENTPFE